MVHNQNRDERIIHGFRLVCSVMNLGRIKNLHSFFVEIRKRNIDKSCQIYHAVEFLVD